MGGGLGCTLHPPPPTPPPSASSPFAAPCLGSSRRLCERSDGDGGADGHDGSHGLINLHNQPYVGGLKAFKKLNQETLLVCWSVMAFMKQGLGEDVCIAKGMKTLITSCDSMSCTDQVMLVVDIF